MDPLAIGVGGDQYMSRAADDTAEVWKGIELGRALRAKTATKPEKGLAGDGEEKANVLRYHNFILYFL